jgi:predicted dehydrogenase
LVGRNERRLRSLAEEHGLTLWTTDLHEALSDPDAEIYFDAQVTSERAPAVKVAMAAGKHVYCEKPIADDLRTAKELAELASRAGVKNGVVQDRWIPVTEIVSVPTEVSVPVSVSGGDH